MAISVRCAQIVHLIIVLFFSVTVLRRRFVEWPASMLSFEYRMFLPTFVDSLHARRGSSDLFLVDEENIFFKCVDEMAPIDGFLAFRWVWSLLPSNSVPTSVHNEPSFFSAK